MPDRKYFTELGINMYCVRVAVGQQHSLAGPELQQYFDADHPCHIYAICRRPRLSMRPEDFRLSPTGLEFTMMASVNGKQQPIAVTAPRQPGGQDFEYRSAYPFTEFELVGPGNRILLRGTTALLLNVFHVPHNPLFDLEVLYVGQAYGEAGERVAPDRLASHSTLQEIYAEAIRRSPDMDIWLVLFGFDDPYILLHMDGTKGHEPQTTEAEDDEHIGDALRTGVTEQQRINYTEAAMIRYFQPQYNKIFKDTFPSPAHKTYAECYDLDLNAVMVELDSEPLGSRLFSAQRAPSWTHFIAYELHSRDERMSMFDFGGGESAEEIVSGQ